MLSQLYSQEEREQSIGPMLRSEPEAVNAKSYFANKSIEDNKRSAVVQRSALEEENKTAAAEEEFAPSNYLDNTTKILSDNNEDNDNYNDDDDDVYDSPRSNFNYSEDDEAIVQQKNKLAIWSYWYPNSNDNGHKGGHYRSNNDHSYIDDESNVLSAYNSRYLPSHGYLLKLGVPSGQMQRGILSHEVLAKRFRHYGYSL